MSTTVSVDAAPSGPTADDASLLPLSAAEPPARWSRAWWAVRVPRPTVLAAVLAGVAVVATPFLVRPVGAALAAAVVLLVLVDALAAVSPLRVRVGRRVPDVLVLGNEERVAWEVALPEGRPRGGRVWLADEFVPSLGAGSRRVALRIPARGRATASTVIRPWRRGTFTFGELTVRVAGPLGLATRQANRQLPARIEVHPAFPSRDRTLLRIEQERLLTAGNRLANVIGGGTEFDHMREYRYGDDVRRVDWGATARLGHPVIRTYRVERDRTVLVLLEHGRASATVVGDVPRLDHGMDAAMALLTAASELGDRGGLLAYAGEVSGSVAPARRADQVARTARALHTLEPQLVEADHRRAFAHAAARQRRRALLVVITDIGAAAAVDELTHALPVLTSRHEVVVVSVSDPDVERMADLVPDSDLAVHHAAGAADVLGRRDAAAQRLVRLGARVVDGPPLLVAEQLVDVYLDLKSRGRL